MLETKQPLQEIPSLNIKLIPENIIKDDIYTKLNDKSPGCIINYDHDMEQKPALLIHFNLDYSFLADVCIPSLLYCVSGDEHLPLDSGGCLGEWAVCTHHHCCVC